MDNVRRHFFFNLPHRLDVTEYVEFESQIYGEDFFQILWPSHIQIFRKFGSPYIGAI